MTDLDAGIANLDRMTGSLVEGAGNKGKINGGRDIMATETKERSALSDQRQAAAAVLVDLKANAAGNAAKI